MTGRRWSQVLCDAEDCETGTKVVLGTIQDARKADRGWHLWNGFDLCPRCWERRGTEPVTFMTLMRGLRAREEANA